MRARSIGATVLAMMGGASARSAAQDAFPAPIGVRVPLAPSPLRAMGHTYLGYELHLDSYLPADVQLRRIQVYLDRQQSPVATYQGAELATMRLAPSGQSPDSGTLKAGGFDVVYLWLELPATARPTSLRHVVTIRAGADEASVEQRVAVRPASDVPILGPPLRGGPWVMAHGPANPNGHRRSYVTIGGRASIPQRYAVDYFKVDSAGHLFRGDTTKKADYYGYGQDVLAVADGIIAVAQNDIPENEVPDPTKRAVPINLRTIGGNYVMLDIGRGRYVFYAHMQPGSVRVKRGDHVRKGQVIGLLGLSGNTPAPHLHVHLGDTTTPLGSEGLPYEYESFDVVGECDTRPATWGWFRSCSFSKPDPRRAEIPLAWKLIRFPQ